MASPGTPDYEAILDALPDASPSELLALLHMVAKPLGARDLQVYLADFEGASLQPIHLGTLDRTGEAEPVAGTMAGRAFHTGAAVVADRDGTSRVWVPVMEHCERTGVLVVTLPSVDEELLAHCIRLGRFAGLLLRSFARTTDLLHVQRRRQPMTLAAGMQWDLLPPLAIRSTRAVACGRLEPAYEIAGDGFDYAMNDEHLHAALFDGMGHGVHSTLMTALAVGAYRHARRSGASLPAMHAAVDDAMVTQYGGEAFVTAAFSRLHLAQGLFEWSTAGHPAPLLLRDHGVLRQLSCAPSLPLGLGGECREVATEQLEPGDCILIYTDGVVEGRSVAGEEFGVERLVERWEHHASSGLDPDEVLRRLVDDVMGHSAKKLRDDASLLLVRWEGPG